jgi:hypothetical protein
MTIIVILFIIIILHIIIIIYTYIYIFKNILQSTYNYYNKQILYI